MRIDNRRLFIFVSAAVVTILAAAGHAEDSSAEKAASPPAGSPETQPARGLLANRLWNTSPAKTTTPTPSTPQYQFARPTLSFEPMQPSFSAAPALPYSPASAWIPASVTTTIDPASYLTNGPEMPESTPELAPTYLD